MKPYTSRKQLSPWLVISRRARRMDRPLSVDVARRVAAARLPGLSVKHRAKQLYFLRLMRGL